MTDLVRQREKIISLTQTEIMFVLATIILILLLGKNTELVDKQNELTQVRNDLQAQQTATAAAIEEDALDEEFIGVLSEQGVIDEDETSSPAQRRESATQAVNNLLQEKQQATELRREIDKKRNNNRAAQSRAESSSPRAHQERLQHLEAMNQNAAIGESAAAALGLDEPTPAAVQQRIGELMQAEQAAQGNNTNTNNMASTANNTSENNNNATQTALTQEEARDIKERIGFLPCWRRAGTPAYYFTYALTYDAARQQYQIAAHPNLQSSAAVVRAALDSHLRVLQNFNNSWQSADELQQFGNQVERAKKAMYGEHTECRLAVSINEEVRGTIIKFIRTATNFYPIYR